MSDPLDGGGSHVGRFFCGLFFILDDPGTLFTDISHLHEEWVQPGFFDRMSEGGFMHQWGARGNYDPVKAVFLDIGFDKVLARI
jgi:hypothetical protein